MKEDSHVLIFSLTVFLKTTWIDEHQMLGLCMNDQLERM
jgi:hypothetical protein